MTVIRLRYVKGLTLSLHEIARSVYYFIRCNLTKAYYNLFRTDAGSDEHVPWLLSKLSEHPSTTEVE